MSDSTACLILKKEPCVWLGGEMSAMSKQFIEKKEIGAIMNCTPDVPCYFFNMGVEYLRIPLGDSRDKNNLLMMEKMLNLAAEWIYVQRDLLGKNILVHCHKGISRSSTCLAAYLIKYKSMDLASVKDMFSLTRQDIFYHGVYATFENVLIDFEKKHFKPK